jgi:hypothetical protein
MVQIKEITAKTKRPAKIIGRNIQKKKKIAPAIAVKRIKIIPTQTVINRTKKPNPREIALNAKYSKSFLKSSPLGLRVISLLQGAKSVLNNKGTEK